MGAVEKHRGDRFFTKIWKGQKKETPFDPTYAGTTTTYAHQSFFNKAYGLISKMLKIITSNRYESCDEKLSEQT